MRHDVIEIAAFRIIPFCPRPVNCHSETLQPLPSFRKRRQFPFVKKHEIADRRYKDAGQAQFFGAELGFCFRSTAGHNYYRHEIVNRGGNRVCTLPNGVEYFHPNETQQQPLSRAV